MAALLPGPGWLPAAVGGATEGEVVMSRHGGRPGEIALACLILDARVGTVESARGPSGVELTERGTYYSLALRDARGVVRSFVMPAEVARHVQAHLAAAIKEEEQAHGR
jgi:hypothetical protein